MGRRSVMVEDLFGPAYGDGALFDLTPAVVRSATVSRSPAAGGVVPPALSPEWIQGTCRLHLPRWDMAWEAATSRGGWPKVNPKTRKVIKRRKVWDALQGNSRVHWTARHAATREVIDAITLAARHAGLGPCSHLTVRLVRVVPTERAMDEDNLWPFFKVCCDALARGPRKDLPGLHLVPDDTPQWMNKLTPRIVHRRGDSGLWLDITPHGGSTPLAD
jgi:crossover junction endodeoxyribonuclease RusA